MKDLFSSGSDRYAMFRPTYPDSLYEFISTQATHHNCAWDCATGNGQVARHLTGHFKEVQATDISAAQLSEAFPHPNIHYSVQPAEQTTFPDQHFDLITIGQAIHWFDFDRFYLEANRTLKTNGVIAVIGYGLHSVFPDIDPIIRQLYYEVIGPYWDPERKYLDEKYQTIPFPFKEIATPSFECVFTWSRAHFLGYLRTWSAVKKFIDQNGSDPVDDLDKAIEPLWGTEQKITFPIFLRLGRKMV